MKNSQTMSQKTESTKKKPASRGALKLLSIIKENGLHSVARELDMTPSKFYNWEYGAVPSMEALEKLSEIIPIDWNTIFYDKQKSEMQKASTLPSDIEMISRIKELEKKVEDLEKLEEENASLKGEVRAYKNMMSGFVKFPNPLTDEEVEKKRKASNFKKAPEGARIMHLNFNRAAKQYDSSEVKIHEIGFIPMWKEREQNASRA